MSAMEKVGRDRPFTWSSSAGAKEHQIKLVGVSSKTEGCSSQKVVVLCKSVLKNVMNTDSPLGFSSSNSLKIAEGRKDIRRCILWNCFCLAVLHDFVYTYPCKQDTEQDPPLV